MGDDRAIVYDEDKSTIYRASGFGHCLRQLVLAKQSYDPMPWPAGIQKAFAAGNAAEDTLIRYLRRKEHPGDLMSSWSLYAFQREYDLELLPNRIIRVHIDALGRHFTANRADKDDPRLDRKRKDKDEPTYDHQYNTKAHQEAAIFGADEWCVEFKAFGPLLMSKFLSSGIDSMPAYKMQVSIEMLATGRRLVFVVMDKDKTSDPDDPYVHYITFDVPPYSKAQLVKRIIDVERHVNNNTLPECGESINDGFCPYYKYHDTKPIVTATLDNQLSELIRSWRRYDIDIKVLSKARDDIRETLKSAIPHDMFYNIDDAEFGFKTSVRKGYDTEGLVEAAIAAGVDVAEFIKITEVVSISNGK